MEWCRLYARLRHDAAVQALPDAAFRLFVESLCYATEAESDGHIPAAQLAKFGRPGTRRNATTLVTSRLWTDTDDGWLITKWDVLQEDLETVRKRRKRDAQRKAERRAEKAGVQGGLHGGLPGGVLVESRREEKNPPDPPSELGGTRCTDHKRPRRGCPDCHLPPLAPVPDWCGECSPSRRVEHPDSGVDLGPCPRCHPSVVRSA